MAVKSSPALCRNASLLLSAAVWCPQSHGLGLTLPGTSIPRDDNVTGGSGPGGMGVGGRAFGKHSAQEMGRADLH